MRQIPLEITRLPGLIRPLEFGSNKTAGIHFKRYFNLFPKTILIRFVL